MRTRWVALLLAAALVVFVGAFIWAALRQDAPAQTTTTGGAPTAAPGNAPGEATKT